MAASSCQTLPSYKVSIRRTKVLPPASFRPHLTVDPLPLAVCLLWSYRTRDFHPLDYTHAGRTPLSGLRRTSPYAGGRTTCAYSRVTYQKIASRSFIVPPAAGGIGIYIMAPKAPYLPSGTVLHTSRGRKPGARPGSVSRSRTEPLAPRAKGPAAPSTLARESGRQPSGIPASTA